MLSFSAQTIVEEQLDESDVEDWIDESKLTGELAVSRVVEYGGLAPVALLTILARVRILTM